MPTRKIFQDLWLMQISKHWSSCWVLFVCRQKHVTQMKMIRINTTTIVFIGDDVYSYLSYWRIWHLISPQTHGSDGTKPVHHLIELYYLMYSWNNGELVKFNFNIKKNQEIKLMLIYFEIRCEFLRWVIFLIKTNRFCWTIWSICVFSIAELVKRRFYLAFWNYRFKEEKFNIKRYLEIIKE